MYKRNGTSSFNALPLVRPVETGRRRALPTGATHAELSLIGFSSSQALRCWIWWNEFSELCSLSTIIDVLMLQAKLRWELMVWLAQQWVSNWISSLFSVAKHSEMTEGVVHCHALKSLINHFFWLIMFTWNLCPVPAMCDTIHIITSHLLSVMGIQRKWLQFHPQMIPWRKLSGTEACCLLAGNSSAKCFSLNQTIIYKAVS